MVEFFGRNKFTSPSGTYDQMNYVWHVHPTTGDRWLEAYGVNITRTTSGGPPPTSATVTMATAATPDELRSIQIINELQVSEQLMAQGGQNLVAARQIKNATISAGGMTYDFANVNGTADGSLAVELSKLFNMDVKNTMNPADIMNLTGFSVTHDRPIGSVSINQYYNTVMSHLGADAENLDKKMKQQDDLMVQINQWRQSTAGVDWNEELTNMIKFQTGYGACSRVLTSMDEILDRLINSTGVVGR